jgi:hypothetical protein
MSLGHSHDPGTREMAVLQAFESHELGKVTALHWPAYWRACLARPEMSAPPACPGSARERYRRDRQLTTQAGHSWIVCRSRPLTYRLLSSMPRVKADATFGCENLGESDYDAYNRGNRPGAISSARRAARQRPVHPSRASAGQGVPLPSPGHAEPCRAASSRHPMTVGDLVRFSRDGDYFHYLWAARRCLSLLSPVSGLIAVTIEGPSLAEMSSAASIEAGEELIDVAEYYGSESISAAERVRYVQLKHSTQNATVPWPPSGLEKTIRGFAQRYQAVERELGTDLARGKLEFRFISNRPISNGFIEAVADSALAREPRHPDELRKLETFSGIRGSHLGAFCQKLHFDGRAAGYLYQRDMLVQDMSKYLPDADLDAPVQLKELITRKALSESARDRTITKIDVLRALKTDEDRLFPAPRRIKSADNPVIRDQEAILCLQIANAIGRHVVIHAAAGVGKSVFSTRIESHLPAGSRCIVYDCFGDGQYRNASAYRHRHRDALVQVANELASEGLCHPLIPTSNADAGAYARAFLHRLGQAVSSLRAKSPSALLCITIDAADNAEMAATEAHEPRSFVGDLLRETMPEGVRLVAICRTHRQRLLDPPPSTLALELNSFNRDETAAFLRYTFPEATEADIDEFARLTSHNPRVQATALAQGGTLSKILRTLGPNPTTVEDTLAGLLAHAVATLRDKVGSVEKSQVDLICAALSVLRPLIPISVLAAIAGVDDAAVESFATDVGRPLVVLGGTIQFFDEPAETWFREKFKPNQTQLTVFIETLKPIASRSAYVASVVPQLLLEAGHLNELVELALSSDALPGSSPIERRDVEIQRLQFALKASLRAKWYPEAAKLAFKAAGEVAGENRQQKLIQANTDIAAAILDVDRVQEIVSRRTFGSGWIGSHHGYEAGLLSGKVELFGDARSRLRMANEWLRNWSRLSPEQHERERIDDADIAEMAMAHLNVRGADACAEELQRWKPREVSYRSGRIVVRRLVDHGRFDDIDRLATAAGENLCLILAVIRELRAVHRHPPSEVVERGLRLTMRYRIRLQQRYRWDTEEAIVGAIVALVEVALGLSVGTRAELAAILTKYVPIAPSHTLSSRFSEGRTELLRAYALQASLTNRSLQLLDLATPDIRKEMEAGRSYGESSQLREFKEITGALLPWHKLWAEVLLSPTIADLQGTIDTTIVESSRMAGGGYREESHVADDVAWVWFNILVECGSGDDPAFRAAFARWTASLKRPLWPATQIQIARVAAHIPSMQADALSRAANAYEMIRDERSDAEAKASTYIDLARAVLTVSRLDAAAYFNQAIEVANKIGDENIDRWTAILDLADRASRGNRDSAEVAYKLSRSAELTYEYVVRDKHFDWRGTARAIAGLSAPSAFAIMSRWRDRGFGRLGRLLPTTTQFLLARGQISPEAAAALIFIGGEWNLVSLVQEALSRCADATARQRVWAVVERYARLEGLASSEWRAIQRTLSTYGLVIPDVEQLIDYAGKKEVLETGARYHSDGMPFEERAETTDWEPVFAGLDLTSANGIAEAYRRFKSTEPPYHHKRFFEQMCHRVPVGGEPGLILALQSVPALHLYDLQGILEQIPDLWKPRPAVRNALANTLKAFCLRYCMKITKSRYDEIFSLKYACELARITEDEVMDVVLAGIGSATDIVGAGRLFTIVSLISSKLRNDDAIHVLTFGLSQFDGMLEEKDGDGAWSPELAPQDSVADAVAGYVWAALAAPEGRLRWEAAHVVRALGALRATKVMDALVRRLSNVTGGPFADARLHFYQLHAQQWLLIALARVARETPAMIAPYVQILVDTALRGQPHVLIRKFAAEALISIQDSGHIQLPANEMHQLRVINGSVLPVEVSDRYGQSQDTRKYEIIGDDKYFFGIDFGPHWLAPLGRCFALSQSRMEFEAYQVIRKDWRYIGGSRWDSDERARRKVYRDRETYYSHSSYPRADDLRFYLSYHAMMVTAGKLFATVAVHQHAESPTDDLTKWISEHGLSRPDGRWLADRRDPVPLDWPSWKSEKPLDEWPSSVKRADLEGIIQIGQDELVLNGWWVARSGRRQETVRVASALVSPERSDALARAFQTVIDPCEARIPCADEDGEICEPGFELSGWIERSSTDRLLDNLDPWAADVGFPPQRPAQRICELFCLTSDEDFRIWRHLEADTKTTNAVAWSDVWGTYEEKSDDPVGEHGQRLRVSSAFATKLLARTKRDLIVKVEIERRVMRYSYERNTDDYPEFLPPYFGVFLLKADGKWRSL